MKTEIDTRRKEWASSVGLYQKHKPQHPHHMEVSLRGVNTSLFTLYVVGVPTPLRMACEKIILPLEKVSVNPHPQQMAHKVSSLTVWPMGVLTFAMYSQVQYNFAVYSLFKFTNKNMSFLVNRCNDP